jgi:Ser/Thr protein kinase RdoA (MazF antagonist)
VTQPLLLEPILAAYAPATAAARWEELGSAGGFSGSRLWRGMTPDGRTFALKAFPAGMNEARLERVHQWMQAARATGLHFVPTVVQCRYGRTVVACGDRCWEMTSWMPGQADFHDNPTGARLIAAVTAVAQIHEAWAAATTFMPCPAIARRLQALSDWERLVRSGWQPRVDANDPVRPDAEAAWAMLPDHIARLESLLAPWQREPVAVQPCLCDIWHDHVLLTGDSVAGVVDFAAAKIDHVSVDLARLLGSLIPDDGPRTALALRSYEAIRPLGQPELVGVLDRTGLVVGVTNWLRWLFHERRDYANRQAVADRLGVMVRRMASW